MSDDEYYDDEYADFHDMLYDADPDPDLADDLAEHAAHSPVYIDNPNEEARDYFSDWEYYSDDYFDDDPILLSSMSKDQADEKPTSRNKQQSAKRGRKRKLSEARDRPQSDTNEMRALRACMQGTVWKIQSPELDQNYGGNSKPVALRLSRAIMRSAYSMKKGFGTGRTTKDESWANDLSLADMGLRTETSIDLKHGGSVLNEDLIEEDDESANDDIGIDQEMTEEEIQVTSNDGHHEHPQTRSPNMKHTIQGQMNGISREDSDNEEEKRRIKRRKVIVSESSTESKNSFITPETSLDPDISDTAMDIELQMKAVPPEKGRGRPKKQATTHTKAHPARSTASADTSLIQQSSHVETTATASTASSRAKRLPSSSATSTSTRTSKGGVSKVTKTNRKTRSQQK